MSREIIIIHSWHVIKVEGRLLYIKGHTMSDGGCLYALSMDQIKGRFSHTRSAIFYFTGPPNFEAMKSLLPDLEFPHDIAQTYPVQSPLLFLYNVFVWKS